MIPRILTRSARLLISLGILLPVVLIGIPAMVAYRAESEVKKSFKWVTHTLEVEGAIQNLVNSLVDAETGQRGFLLTRQEPYLEPYHSGIARVGQQVADLKNLTRESSAQQQRLDQIQPLIRERLELLAETVARERRGEHEAALELVNSGRGKFVMDQIRGVLREMGDDEHRLVWVRQRQLSKQAWWSTVVLWTLVVVSALLAAALLHLIYRMSRLEPLAMCAASRTIEYQGKWLSFEEYLQQRFGLSVDHVLSPAERERLEHASDPS